MRSLGNRNQIVAKTQKDAFTLNMCCNFVRLFINIEHCWGLKNDLAETQHKID